MTESEGTVLIVDDDAAVRRSVSRLVRAAGFSAKTYSSPFEFLTEPPPDGPACVVLDLHMDGMTGLEVQEKLAGDSRRVPIVFLTGCGTVPDAIRGMKRGAEDFLEKPVRPKTLIEAICHAIARDRAGAEERQRNREMQSRYQALTPRERQVMRMVVSGRLNKQSAAELGISEKTIKVHRARVMEKMQVESLPELVRLAEQIEIQDSTRQPLATQRA